MKSLIIILCFFVTTITYSQRIDSLTAIVDRAAAVFMKAPGAVGVSVGIYQLGKTHKYSYGVTDIEKKSKVSSSSIFPIASLSKTFTGQLLAMAQIENKLSMQDDIRKYLDEPYPNLEYGGQPIKLIHLVSHVSRLPIHLSDRADSIGYSRKDFYADLHNVTLDTIPGIRFMYSNAGVQLLGFILEKVYGQSYETLLITKLCQPLGMKHTKVDLVGNEMKMAVKGYTEKGINDQRQYNYLQAAGGIRSNVDDMLKYISFQIAENKEATKLSHSEVWGFDMGGGNHYSFGLGWQIIKNENGTRRISQDGNLPGYSSVIIFFPERKVGIVILSNSFMMDHVGGMADAILKNLENN